MNDASLPAHSVPRELPSGGTGPASAFRMPRLVAVLIALPLAVAFVILPWEQISGQGFPDLDNYLRAIALLMRERATSFDMSDTDLLALLTNEWLWREILIFVGNTFVEPLQGLLLVSFVAVLLTTAFVLRRAGLLYALVFLLAPLTVDLFISQTRSALAVAVLMLAIAARTRKVRYPLMVAAFMLHSVAAVLIASYYVNAWLLSRPWLHSRMKLGGAAGFGVAVAVVWAFLSVAIFLIIGNRRADQEEALIPVTVTFSLFWILISGVIITFARLKPAAQMDQCTMFAVTMLLVFICATFFGIGALRFLSLALPFIVIAVRTMTDPILRGAVLAAIIAFNLIHLSYWMQ